MAKLPAIKIKDGKKYFFRFTLDQRIQHIVLFVTVIVLVLTGMPLKFHDMAWAAFVYKMLGGIRGAPIVHKVTGSVLLLLFAYHLVYLFYNIYKEELVPLKKAEGLSPLKVLKVLAAQPLVPNFKDAIDIRDLMKYLLFLTDKHPAPRKFSWKEKFDYWVPFWGILIIGLSGLIMWNKILATKLLPGYLINFSLIAHSDEALLAALFLFIWHWYNVHLSTSVFPMGTVFLTGYLSEGLMIEEHYEYYVEVMKKEGLEHEIRPPHGEHGHQARRKEDPPAAADTYNRREGDRTP
ncbi:formate dehydrogenase-O subunit gamma [bacterium BMS3Abin10]|nr:formate dehydrogenase-O subunit gamma [bacterium BMS3Abin10]GBE38028.1 formate dehydrogenase-O subunit gamma [bacterium BMS3Bbin08]